MKARVLFLVFASALAVTAGAQDRTSRAQVGRNTLETHDQSGVNNKEIVIGTATFPVGTSVGFHTHPGDESGFVVKGSIILKTRGQPDRHLVTGESFFNARGAVHSVVAGPEGAIVVSTWIVDKGVPISTPVP
jgi:quercetin dioxygenase-like cupin family protein